MAYRVLFVNEFGSGLTHFNALLGAYRRMSAEADIEARFYVTAVDDVKAAGIGDVPVFGTPQLGALRKPKNKHQSRTYGEIVHNAVFGKHPEPGAWFKAWEATLAEFDPHLIVMDYAPVVQMVAYGRWPTIVIGYGYTMPPSSMKKFVTFGSEEPKPKEERAITEQFNMELKKVGARLWDKLPDMCAVDRQVNATVPAFDPYIDHREDKSYAGIYHPGGSPWPKPGEARGGLAYFHAFSQSDEGLLEGLKATGLDFGFYAGPPSEKVRSIFAGSKVAASEKPFSLKEMLPGKAVCVHMGGQGVALAALFAGVPQLMLHTHQENAFNARMVAMQGAGIAHPMKTASQDSVPSLILEAANDVNMRNRAFAMGRALAQYRDADPVAVLAREALSMLKA
jgi:rhamnosyltransferase subunit B